MKTLFTICAMAAAVAAQGQITLNQSSFTSWTPGNEAISDNLPQPTIFGNNVTWDHDTMSRFGTSSYGYAAVTDPAFPNATYRASLEYSFSAFGYQTNGYTGVTATGIQRFGEKIVRQAFPIGALTGNPQDSLVFLEQTVQYSSPRNILFLPAAPNATGGSNYNFSTNFTISATPYGLNNAPAIRRTYVKLADTVKGWGKMRIPDANGDVSGYMDVLAVQTAVENRDSFFLGGNPAPPQLLGAFGITQGMVTKAYRVSWFRAGETVPLMMATYTDSTYTTQSANETHISRLAAPVKVSTVAAAAHNMVVYPNPVANGTLNISMTDVMPGLPCTYVLSDVTGKAVATGNIYVNGGKAAIAIGEQATGMYSLNIYQQGQLLATQKVMVK